MAKSLMNRTENFGVKHKIISFLIIMVLMILISRIIVRVSDINIVIKDFEIHHFHYGLILLIITALIMLFRRGSFNLYLLLTAISIGLIVDEFLFIGTKTRGPIEYSSTLGSTILLVIIIMLIIEFILYISKKKRKSY